MNKKLILIRNIMFLVTICLLLAIRLVSSIMTPSIIIMYLLLVVLVIILANDIKKKHKIEKDTNYQIAFILAMLLIDIILLRSMFDYNIVTVKFIKNFAKDDLLHMAYFKANIWYIITSFVLLIVYRLTYDIKLPKISIKIDFKDKSQK